MVVEKSKLGPVLFNAKTKASLGPMYVVPLRPALDGSMGFLVGKSEE
jgi:hypothetical protein